MPKRQINNAKGHAGDAITNSQKVCIGRIGFYSLANSSLSSVKQVTIIILTGSKTMPEYYRKDAAGAKCSFLRAHWSRWELASYAGSRRKAHLYCASVQNVVEADETIPIVPCLAGRWRVVSVSKTGTGICPICPQLIFHVWGGRRSGWRDIEVSFRFQLSNSNAGSCPHCCCLTVHSQV